MMKVITDHLLSTMPLEDAKPHFFKLYQWISQRSFNNLQYLRYRRFPASPFCSDVDRDFFNEEKTVYVLDRSDGAKLVSLDQCIWRGPSWLQTGYTLMLYEEYASNAKIRGLFSDILAVPDADTATYIAELIHVQDVGVGLIDKTQRVYQAIIKDIKDKEDYSSLW